MIENMTISGRGLALIREFEGFSSKPYRCPAGKPTIGYGHVILPSEGHLQAPITLEQAETLLLSDCDSLSVSLSNLLISPPLQGQFDAMASLAYNIGIQAFEKSLLLRFFNAKNPEAAARQFSRWVYVSGKPSPGLIRRRAAETLIFREKI